MRLTRWMLILSLSVPVLMTACQSRPVPPEPEPDAGLVLATIDDQKITQADIEGRIEAIEEKYPRKYATFTQKKDLVEQMVNLELLYQEALRRDFDKRYEFRSRMADLYVRELAKEARAAITEEELRKIYNQFKDEIDQISARHILLKTDDKMSAEEKSDRRKKISDLRDQLLKEPDEFPNLARVHSEDGSRGQGGELGFFNRYRMVPPFSKAAFKLQQIGEISPVVETRFGYHIIQLTGDQRGYEHHKDVVRNKILRDTQAERLQEELERLKKGKKIEIYADNIRDISPLPEIIQEGTTKPSKEKDDATSE